MKISLVINTYNRLNSLPNTLEAIESLRYRELEVVVVDGPSKDGTYDYLKKHWADKVKICSCSEANLSISRNIGIMNASGEVICFIDDDGVPEPDWLNQLVLAYSDPAVAAAGGWVRDHTGVDYQTKYIASSRDSTSLTNIENPESMPACVPHADPFPGLIGVNSSFRRSSLLEVGGFDEEYAYFLDETDVLARLVDAGHSIVILPDAEVHHKYAASHIRHESGAAKSWYQIMKSTAYFILKNAAPDCTLSERLKLIAEHRKKLGTYTTWFLANGMIDKPRYQRLLSEIEMGADNGIRDHFKYPLRQLLKQESLTKWWPFPRPLSSSDRIRVAFVTRQYPPVPCGGVAIFIHHLARALAAMGHEVTVITQAESGRRHTVDFEERVWVHRLPEYDSARVALPENMPDMPGELANLAGRVLAELDRMNERRQFDCVVGAIWDLDLAAVIASKRYPVAMYLVTSYKLMEESKPEWRSNKHFFEHHVKKMFEAEKWAVASADRIIASTEAIRRDTEAAYGITIDDSRLNILPFGVPGPEKHSQAEGPARDEIRLLYVGRLEPRKGIEDLLDVLPALMEDLPDLTVICIGDKTLLTPEGGTYSEKFLQKHRSAPWLGRVSFPGHVDPECLDRNYAECDVFVAPSRYESFGLIYLEAMRYGKPCVGTDAGGIPEVVTHNETGLLVPPGDRPALRDAIRTLVEKKELRMELGENGRRRFEEGFTTEIFARNFDTYLRQWIQESGTQAEETKPAEAHDYKTA